MRSRWLPLVCVVALAAACSSGGGTRSSTTTTVSRYPLDNSLRLDQIQVLASHNSYHGRPYPEVLTRLRQGAPGIAATLDYAHAPLPQQFDLGVRQIELDVYDDPAGGKYARPTFPASVGVKLTPPPEMLQPGFKIIHEANVDTNSTCLTFVACLRLLAAWSDAHPGHVAMQVQIEMKDDRATEAMFRRLDDEITSVFSRGEIVTPDDVRGNAQTLGAAVAQRG